MVTELGMGAMDTPQVPEGEETLNLAIDAGINFIDTARIYQGSEYLIGQVIRARGRKEFHIGSKTIYRDMHGSQYDVERSLGVLGVQQIDLYQLHDVSTPIAWEKVMSVEGALSGLKIAQKRGLIKYIGISCHNLEVLENAIESGEFDTVMLEYSAFYSETERLIRMAKERDLGIIVMRPLGGSGRTSSIRTEMQNQEHQVFLTPEMLLRYVFSNPDISVAIPGVRYPSRISENVQVADGYAPLSSSERQQCETEANRLF
jgi:predicted aldo/keto reductase-like oxidoreductase